MTPVEIKNALERIEDTIREKGYYNPKITMSVGWIGYDLTIHINYRTEPSSLSLDKFIHDECGVGFDGMIRQAEQFVTTMQSIADAKRDQFIAAVGRLIEQGRDIGMEVEFLNPLTDMMTKLSTNILEKK